MVCVQVAFNLDGHEKTIWDLKLSSDEVTLYSASADRTARVWRVIDGLVRSRTVLRKQATEHFPCSAAVCCLLLSVSLDSDRASLP